MCADASAATYFFNKILYIIYYFYYHLQGKQKRKQNENLKVNVRRPIFCVDSRHDKICVARSYQTFVTTSFPEKKTVITTRIHTHTHTTSEMGKAGQKNVTKKKVSQVGSKEALMREAEEALSMFDYERACMKMESALQLAPTDTDIMDKLGEVAVSYLGEEEKGLAVLRRSIEVAPDSGYTKYMTVGQAIGGGEGLQYYKKGAENLAAMMQVCTDATELADLKDSMAQCFCAVAELWTTDLCMEEGAEHQCKAALDFAAQHNPKNVELHYLYAQLNLRLDKIDESKASLQQCTALLDALDEEQHPSTDIKVEIGKLLMQVNEWSEAYQFLKLLLLEDDGNGYLWYLMGETLKHMGNFRRYDLTFHSMTKKEEAKRAPTTPPHTASTHTGV